MKSSFFYRHGLLILMGATFLCPLILTGTQQAMLSNSNDVKSWLPPAYDETATFAWYWQRFEGDAFILASWEGCTLDSPSLPLLARKLVPPPEIAQTLKQPVFFRAVRTGKQLVDDLVDKQGVAYEEAIRRLQGCLIGADGKQTCLVLYLSRPAMEAWDAALARGETRQRFMHAAVDHVYEVAERECAIPRQRLRLGGPPVDNVSIDIEGERSMLRLAGVSAVIGILMSWWCLRSWKLTLTVLSAALLSAGASLATIWFSGAKMNAILLTMPPLVYVAATSGAIHLANYYRDAIRQGGLEGATDRAVAAAWLPLALATGTTAVGLASLTISELVPIKMFGIFSAIGVVISFIVICTYVPAVLELFPVPHIAAPAKSRGGESRLAPIWRRTGMAIIRHNRLVTAACLVLMIAGAYGVTRVETSVRLMRLFSPQARILQDYAWLEERLGPLVPMEVIIRVDKEKSKLDLYGQMQLVASVQQAVAGMDEVGSALAAPTFARPLPRRAGVLQRQTWNVLLDKHRHELREYLYSEEKEELWRVSARVGALEEVDYGLFATNIRGVVEPILEAYRQRGAEGISATYTGVVPLIYKAQRSMLDGLILGFAGDLILIGIAMVMLMRNLSSGFLLMLPSLFPLALVFGAMGWAGVVVDTGTVMTPAVALGVTIDDAIHFMLWCRHGQERGMDRTRAIMFAYEDCARAIYQSWAVIGLGLSAFALSSFMPTKRFGYLMFTMLTISSIGNLVFLPALLAGPAGYFFWRRRAKDTAKAAERAGARHDLAEAPACGVPHLAHMSRAARP